MRSREISYCEVAAVSVVALIVGEFFIDLTKTLVESLAAFMFQ